MTFDEAFEAVIGHEAGYVNNRADPGGETKYGISKRSYPDEDIKRLSLARAKQIYRRDFWIPAKCEHLPAELRFHVFDAAVNSGVRQAIVWLQQAVGTEPDGWYGPITAAAVRAMDPRAVALRINGHRLQFMTDLKTWPTFGKGWARRVAKNLIAAGATA